MPVVDNKLKSRFELETENDVAFADYVRSGDTITFTHTLVPEHIRERGSASKIAKFALDQARAEGLKVVPQCPFIAAYIQKHPEYESLVRPEDQH